MEKEKERYRGEWGDRQVGMCGKSKMEPEKRGNREQGVQGTLSHTLIHTHTHTLTLTGGVQHVLTKRKYKGTTPQRGSRGFR